MAGQLFSLVAGEKYILGEKYRKVLSVLLRMDALTRALLLQYHASWLQTQDKNCTFRYDRLTWLYFLLAVVEKPLDGGTMASVRETFLKCSTFRGELGDSPLEVQDEIHEDSLKILNVLITISGLYFGQAGQQ